MVANPAQKEEMHILVIGAGATGLLIAHGLKKAGIKVSVFEHEASAQTYRPREWTMGIHWSLPLLESLLPENLRPRLAEETYVDPSVDWESSPNDRLRMFDGTTGEIMKDIPVSGKIVRVSRRKLRSFLSQEIDVEYDRQLVDIKYSPDNVTAVFANGAEVTGSLIVGCDGPRSAVRNLLFGSEKATAKSLNEVIHVNTSICFEDAEKAKFVRSMHPVFAMAMHPDLFLFISILDVPEEDKPETWRFQILGGWLGDREGFPDNESRVAELKRRAGGICEPFRSAVQWLADDKPLTFDKLAFWESERWDTHNGRVTLAGDAAHPMPPHRGQGLNHAIQDAYNLVGVLTESSSTAEKDDALLATQIQSYSDEVAQRGGNEVKLSKQSAFMTLGWKEFRESPIMKHSLDRSPALGQSNWRSKDAKDVEHESKSELNGDSDKENDGVVGALSDTAKAVAGV